MEGKRAKSEMSSLIVADSMSAKCAPVVGKKKAIVDAGRGLDSMITKLSKAKGSMKASSCAIRFGHSSEGSRNTL